MHTSLPSAFPGFAGNSSNEIVKSGKNGNIFVLILDESGSMSGVTNDTIGGVNSLIESQKKDPIKTRMKIVKFEGGNISTIRDGFVDNHHNLTSKDYHPKGGTNLLDAVGQTLLDVNIELSALDESERPSVIFQITTDGEENQSTRFDLQKVKNLISKATDAGWMFTFIGANIDAFRAATSMGINVAGVSSYNVNNTVGTFRAMNSSVTRMKSAMNLGATSSQIYASGSTYTEEERKEMTGGKK